MFEVYVQMYMCYVNYITSFCLVWWVCTWQGFGHNKSFVFLVESDVYFFVLDASHGYDRSMT